MAYKVSYTDNVTEFIIEQVTSERVYNKINKYRFILADFPDIGAPFEPLYPAARPPFPCRWIAVPDTPFTLYYTVELETESIVIFFVEHQGTNPQDRFDWSIF